VKFILSRKGFDSGSGGCPSPIFPDLTMLALPIPDATSRVRYRDLTWNGRNLGELVPRLAGATPMADHGAHLDPDLCAEALLRQPGWRPVFGQRGAARGHIRNRGVAEGDVFLFFGLFREVGNDGAFVPGSPGRHVVWGWMQIGEILAVDDHRERLAWASYHPHLTRGADRTNFVYVAADRLELPGTRSGGPPGAGAFPRFSPALQLTASSELGLSTWRLPGWFHPEGRRSALSYHGNPDRWSRDGESVLLRTVGRGQEFVIDGDDYPEVVRWAGRLITTHGRGLAGPKQGLTGPSGPPAPSPPSRSC
jgi:hypothetical protein